MTARRILGGAIATVLLANVAALGLLNAPVANAGTVSGTGMTCGGGYVRVQAPQVTTQQGFRGGSDMIQWRAELWYYDGGTRSFQPWQNGDYRSATVATNAGPSLGSSQGWAGPTWYGPNGGTDWVYFSAPAGWYYAVRQVVYDRGEWLITWAVDTGTYAGQTYCAG